jgi:hypothetical protein
VLVPIDQLDFLFGEPSFVNRLDPGKTEKKAFVNGADGLELTNQRMSSPDFNYGEFAGIKPLGRGRFAFCHASIPTEFDGIRMQTGLNSFVLTPKQWIERTGTVGLRSSAGRYGGTYAHKDIAFEFASWVSVEFKLYLIKEFQRLKDDENDRLKLGWNLQRTLAKINYRIHTDAQSGNQVCRREYADSPAGDGSNGACSPSSRLANPMPPTPSRPAPPSRPTSPLLSTSVAYETGLDPRSR